jgi:hypothetical protein
MNDDSSAPDRLVRLGYAFREAKTLLSAVELDVFTVLADGRLGLDDLTARIGVHRRGARDFFDALVSLRLLERDAACRYGNTAETDRYLDRRKPSYIGGDLEFANARQFGPWSLLTAALRSGRAQNGARGTDNYRAYYSDAAVLENVAKGMTGATLRVADAIARRFPWGDYTTLVDIGTAQGCLPVRIALAHPHIVGGGFDLPAMSGLFDTYVRQHGLDDRLRFYPGDFFQEPLPAADVLVMGRVLHNWDLAAKKSLLGKAYDALPTGGALIVYERLIDDERRTNAAGFMASLNMLVMTADGFDYSGADCKGWMVAAGFRRVEVTPLTAEQSMIVARK